MRNTDGKYIASRLMKDTGAQLTGTGSSKEEARAALKNAVKKYRESMAMGLYLQPTGRKVKSPGMVAMRTDRGMITLKQDEHRTVQTLARPDLAKYIREGSKSNILKETRQLRRQAARR